MRPQQTTESEFAAAVRRELQRLLAEHSRPLTTPEEVHAWLRAHLGKFWELVLVEMDRGKKERSPGRLLFILLRIGAIAQRAAHDLRLIEPCEPRDHPQIG
jgi:hypothetical protein